MRILHISDCYAPRTGGIETQVRNLAEAQAFRGHDVEVVTATPGEPVIGSPVTVHRVTMRLPGELPIHVRTRSNVARLLARHTPSVVHVHAGAVSPFAWGGVRASLQAGIPTVVTVHSVWGPLASPAARMAHRIVRWVDRGAVVTSVSAMAARRVADALGLSEVLVTPNGIDVERWSPQEPQSHDRLSFIAVQRLAPRKRSVELIDMFAEVATTVPDAHLTIVGDGPQRNAVEKRVAYHQLQQQVLLTGRVGYTELRQLLSASDVFVQPSVMESFGIAALEARSSGLPVIAFVGTGTADFIHSGIEGVLVKSDACMVRAMTALGTDRDLRGMITEHNRTTRPVENWDYVVAVVDDAYRRAGAH